MALLSGPKVRGNASFAQSVKQVERILDRPCHRHVPRVRHLRQVNVVLEVKLIYQSVVRPVWTAAVQQLTSERQLDGVGVNVHLEHHEVVLAVVTEDGVQGV